MPAGSGLTAAADLSVANTLLAKASGGYSTTGANWVALYTTQFQSTAKAGGVEWSAASDTSYVRQAMGAAGAGWTVNAYVTSTGVMFQNTNQVLFPAVATTAQNLYSVGFCDALTAGNIQLFSDLPGAAATPVALGIQVQFNALTDIQFTVY